MISDASFTFVMPSYTATLDVSGVTAPTIVLGCPYGGADSVAAFSGVVANFMKSTASAARGDFALMRYPSGDPSIAPGSPLPPSGTGRAKMPKFSGVRALPSAVTVSNSRISW
ncbi:hypothetical protein QFZ29_002969 [Agromyces albus]|nr:hypothetical protein [Agromyces albus]